MNTINLTLLRKNLFNKVGEVIKYNETLTVNTKDGNAVIMSEDDYNAIYETVYLMSQPEVMKKIKAGEKEDIKKMKKYNQKEIW